MHHNFLGCLVLELNNDGIRVIIDRKSIALCKLQKTKPEMVSICYFHTVGIDPQVRHGGLPLRHPREGSNPVFSRFHTNPHIKTDTLYTLFVPYKMINASKT